VLVCFGHGSSFVVNANHGAPNSSCQVGRIFSKLCAMKMTTLPLGNLMNRSPLRLGFLLIPLVLGCFALSPTALAVVPAPDGAYNSVQRGSPQAVTHRANRPSTMDIKARPSTAVQARLAQPCPQLADPIEVNRHHNFYIAKLARFLARLVESKFWIRERALLPTASSPLPDLQFAESTPTGTERFVS